MLIATEFSCRAGARIEHTPGARPQDTMTTTINDLLRNGCANVCVTLSLADLRDFVTELLEQRTTAEALEPTDVERPGELMTRDEVCEYLGVTKPTLHRWNKLGYLTNVHVGRKVRYRREDVEAFAVK